MNYNTNVQYKSLEDFVTSINDLGIDLLIEHALKSVRKEKLEKLIDQALQDKDEEAFNHYTSEYIKLEDSSVDMF
ncbi:IDEAL domain-containing protein [Staphylococcus sp. SQ8-PEA]|uniref:IDEAL domain-containing protein n=1 Tax=Staphylococcus marylandisciuri TaxID=2981529 RepID=A0ABT2QPW7_9STAP|nr:IDEAL domain-containing protein [Staphylococcus marylandisciuri]MCU5746017.1 IDEAL domain-containing protein [Staphylococcus marylandisciuri]